jgi:hypothetical protein
MGLDLAGFGIIFANHCVMKKRSIAQLILVFLAGICCTAVQAQPNSVHGDESPVQIGTMTLNFGIGAGAYYGDANYGTPFGTKVSAERGMWQAGPGVITLGGEIGGSLTNGWYYTDYEARTFILAVRSAWHYGWQVRGLDTYGGFSTGAGFHHYAYKTADVSYDHNQAFPVFGAYVGASYFVSPSFGFNAEAGYDITNFQVGVVFRMQ